MLPARIASSGHSAPYHRRLMAASALALPSSNGQQVYYVVTNASDGSVAAATGVNTSQKLANAANTAGVEKVRVNPDGTIVFPATVNFNPTLRWPLNRHHKQTNRNTMGPSPLARKGATRGSLTWCCLPGEA